MKRLDNCAFPASRLCFELENVIQSHVEEIFYFILWTEARPWPLMPESCFSC